MKKYIVFLCIFLLPSLAYAEVTGLEDCDTYLGDTVCFDGEPMTREEMKEYIESTEPMYNFPTQAEHDARIMSDDYIKPRHIQIPSL